MAGTRVACAAGRCGGCGSLASKVVTIPTTINAAITSQFEQQARAVCGLPLGCTDYLRPAVMANLLGDLWQDGEPDWAAALALPGVKLHLYGKHAPRPGRKMGHLTALADSVDEALDLAVRARQALSPPRT